jgi:amino-acid N-acetyltransferase
MIRKATLVDASAIHQLINSRAKQGEMLGRSLAEIYENIRDYYVAESRGVVVGVCGLHICWEDLAEIKSLAVKPNSQSKGLGRLLVLTCLDEGKTLKIKRFFALTYVPDFFKKVGFKRIKREVLPHKIWSDCIKCPHFPNCNEIAMMLDLGRKNQVKKSKKK